MSEINDILVRAELQAQRAVLWALLGTHNEPERLRHRFAIEAAALLSNLQASPVPDATVGSVEMMIEKWQRDIEKVTAPYTPPSQ
jgi:hypothetical protein